MKGKKMEKLPAEVIQKDRELEGTAQRSSEALAQLRWHWTKDEANPDRVSIRTYAAQVGRTEGPIQTYAMAWEVFRTSETPIDQALLIAQVGEERASVVQAIATAEGVKVATVRGHHGDHVKRVHQQAQEAAERKGTTVAQEAQTIADFHAKAKKADADIQKERKARLGFRFIEMEKHLAYAKRRLVDALKAAHEVDWNDEQKDLLRDSVRNVQAVLELLSITLDGAADIDWDAELSALVSDG